MSFITLLVVLLRRRRQRLLDEGGPLVEEAGIPLEELITLEGKQEEDILPVLPEDTAQERVRLLVEKHPDVAVSILRSWLVEK